MDPRILLMLSASLCQANGYIRLCYYTNWSQFRPNGASFTPEDVNPRLCSHIVFAFAKLRNNKLETGESNDDSSKNETGAYEQINALKKRFPKLRTLLAVGGWEAASAPFSSMAATPENRTEFLKSTIEFLRKRDFDGLDLDWEYPTKRGGRKDDKEKLTLLLQELRAGFEKEAVESRKRRLLLTAAVPASKRLIDSGYDVPAISKSVDFLILMTYDLHGFWDGYTGLNSPLYTRRDQRYFQSMLNVNWVTNYWLRRGAPIQKLVIGVPLYGRSFRLKSETDHGIGAPTIGPGPNGTYTNDGGFLAYYEICLELKRGAKRVWDPQQRAPYMYTNSTWVGFENPRSVREKMRWLRKRMFAGVMIWSLDLDDFSGKFCGYGKYPLLRTINRELMRPQRRRIKFKRRRRIIIRRVKRRRIIKRH